MDRPAGHVDRLDLLCGRGPDCREIAVADREIVFYGTTEATKTQDQRLKQLLILGVNVDRKASLLHSQLNAKGPGIILRIGSQRLEMILLEQVEDGDASLLLDIGIAPDDRLVIEIDGDDARIGHCLGP